MLLCLNFDLDPNNTSQSNGYGGSEYPVHLKFGSLLQAILRNKETKPVMLKYNMYCVKTEKISHAICPSKNDVLKPIVPIGKSS